MKREDSWKNHGIEGLDVGSESRLGKNVGAVVVGKVYVTSYPVDMKTETLGESRESRSTST